ncbi:DUF2018 family protein [Campylobacter sp. RM9328]|uniref:DUF2018 family protein n=1 Tax=Campylobacter sp. RM9328 TaxID=1705720 RepID=UPI0014742BFB|nr:DUF2018 family protein [Campylobacter sp. RM9328]
MQDIFNGSLRDKFFEILFYADKNIVSNELDKIFEELIAMREICEQKGISNTEILSFKSTNPQGLQDGLNDLYIGLSGEILSQNE